MSAESVGGSTVLLGYWMYDGEVRKPVEVVSLDYDYYFEQPSDDGRSEWRPYPLGADGLLYYVMADGGDLLGTPPFLSAEDARKWADEQPWAPIQWIAETASGENSG